MAEFDQLVKTLQSVEQHLEVHPNAWVLFINGSSAANGSGVGIVFKTPKGALIEQAVQLGFKTSNNEGEYEALIVGMKKEKKLGIKHLVIYCDSQLVANQFTGEYAASNERMGRYMRMAQKLFRDFKIQPILNGFPGPSIHMQML